MTFNYIYVPVQVILIPAHSIWLQRKYGLLTAKTTRIKIIRILSQDVNLNQETKRGLQKLTVNVNSWQQELTRVFNEIEIPHLGEQDVHEMNLLHKAKQEKQEKIREIM